MKVLAVASAVDLDFRYGCTPAWWQLWKGLYEVGVDLIVTPYRGRPIESPWWRTYPNPCYREAEQFDPASSQKIFRFHLSDIGEARFLPALMAALHRNAPGVRVQSSPLSRLAHSLRL